MSELLAALDRAEKALAEIVDMDPPGEIFSGALVAQAKISDLIKELEEEIGEKEIARLEAWNRSFKYQPRAQEARIP